MNTETSYTLDELARATGYAIEELIEMVNKVVETTQESCELLAEAWKEYKDEDIIRERSYEGPNKRSHRILNAESKRKSRVAFHAAPGTRQYIRGRDGGGRYR